MPAGRKPKPVNVLKLQGTYRPHRHDKSKEQGSDIDTCMIPPEHLSERAREIFNGLYQKLLDINGANTNYTDMLGLAAVTLEEVELLTKSIDKNGCSYMIVNAAGEELLKANPEVKLRADAIRRSQQLLNEFGLSGSSSMKLGTIKQNTTENSSFDEWDKFLNTGTGNGKKR